MITIETVRIDEQGREQLIRLKRHADGPFARPSRSRRSRQPASLRVSQRSKSHGVSSAAYITRFIWLCSSNAACETV